MLEDIVIDCRLRVPLLSVTYTSELESDAVISQLKLLSVREPVETWNIGCVNEVDEDVVHFQVALELLLYESIVTLHVAVLIFLLLLEKDCVSC